MTQVQRSGRRRRRGKPVQLLKCESVAFLKNFLKFSHSLACVREGSLHHYKAAIMDCCLARGPLMKEAFSSCAPLRENAATFKPQSVTLLRF